MHQGTKLGNPDGGEIRRSEAGESPQVLFNGFEPEFFFQIQVFIEKLHVVGIIQSFLLQEASLAEKKGFQLKQVVFMSCEVFQWQAAGQHFKRLGIDLEAKVAGKLPVKGRFPVVLVLLQASFNLMAFMLQAFNRQPA